MNRIITLFLLAVSLMCYCMSLVQADEPKAYSSAATTFKEDTLKIKSGTKTHRFTIEVAQTPEQLELGLMYRTEMAANHGMLFLMGKEEPIYMWMKNTVLSLDMLFIDSHGRIIRVTPGAKPYSTNAIDSGSPASAVLELPGGTAKKLGIREGDQVLYSAFAP